MSKDIHYDNLETLPSKNERAELLQEHSQDLERFRTATKQAVNFWLDNSSDQTCWPSEIGYIAIDHITLGGRHVEQRIFGKKEGYSRVYDVLMSRGADRRTSGRYFYIIQNHDFEVRVATDKPEGFRDTFGIPHYPSRQNILKNVPAKNFAAIPILGIATESRDPLPDELSYVPTADVFPSLDHTKMKWLKPPSSMVVSSSEETLKLVDIVYDWRHDWQGFVIQIGESASKFFVSESIGELGRLESGINRRIHT